MKNLLVIVFVLLGIQSVHAEKKVVESKISQVTIYPVGAMIERSASLMIPKGNNLIILNQLTHAVDPNTIQVGGTGDFEILSVKFELFYPYAKSKPAGIKAIEDSIKLYNDQSYLLKAEDASLNQEKELILKNKQLSNGKTTLTVTQLDAMAKYFRAQLKNINTEKLRNQNERIEVNAELTRLRSALSGMNKYKYEQEGRIVVETSAKQSVRASFDISFYTHLAGWFPKYNIKSESEKTNIDVNYNALVNQTTGVDWKNIDLVLATTRPNYNNQKPEIHPWYLDYYNSYKVRGARSNMYEMTVEESDDYESGVVSNADSPVSTEQFVKLDKKASYSSGNQVLNALNTSYKINSKYTVLSNSNNKQVFIKQIQIPAGFNHYAVPSMEKEAFLTASIADWGQYDLIPGNATLFYNNTYVGKTYIYSNTTEDTLQISLGRDQGVVLTRDKIKDLCTSKKVGSNTRKNYMYEISVRNTNKKDVTVVVKDRVPVSKRNDILVTLNGIDGAEFNKDTGILTWRIQLPASGKKTVSFGYEVKYPKDKKVNL